MKNKERNEMEISYFVGECFPGMKVINFHHFHFLENVNDVEQKRRVW